MDTIESHKWVEWAKELQKRATVNCGTLLVFIRVFSGSLRYVSRFVAYVTFKRSVVPENSSRLFRSVDMTSSGDT